MTGDDEEEEEPFQRCGTVTREKTQNARKQLEFSKIHVVSIFVQP